MANNFTAIMSEKSDEELINILNEQRNDYQPEAVEAAEAELANRNIFPDPKIFSLKQQLLELESQQSTLSTAISAPKNQKLLLFILLAIGGIVFLMAIADVLRGKHLPKPGIAVALTSILVLQAVRYKKSVDTKKISISLLKEVEAEIEEIKSQLGVLENN